MTFTLRTEQRGGTWYCDQLDAAGNWFTIRHLDVHHFGRAMTAKTFRREIREWLVRKFPNDHRTFAFTA